MITKLKYSAIIILSLLLIYQASYSQSGIITFDEQKWRSVLDYKLYNGGPNNTLSDTELGVNFIVSYGEMFVTRTGYSGNWTDYMLFFSPIITAKTPSVTDPVGRVLIQFSNSKKYVRLRLAHDEHPIKSPPYYFTIKFYKDYNPSNPLHSEDITNIYSSFTNVEYSNTTTGIQMIIVDTHFAENDITEIEFVQSGTEPDKPQSLTPLNGYNGAIPLAWNVPSGKISNHGYSTKDVEISFQPTSDQRIAAGGLLLKINDHTNVALSDQTSFKLNSSDPLGYNIYRSTSSSGSYTKIADKINRQYYRDESAANDQTYYYKITAVYSTGESDYSNISSAQAEADGFMIKSGWTTSTPTLNGVIQANEWANAKTVLITYLGLTEKVTLYVMNTASKLFLAVDDQRDQSLNDNDSFGIFFDDNHNREWPASAPSGEGLLQLFWSTGSAKNNFQGFHGVWPGNCTIEASTTPSGVIQGIAGSSGHVQYEASFDLNSSPINATPGDIIGILFYIWEGGTGTFTGLWPQQTERLKPLASGYGWAHAPFSYGDLKLAASTSFPDIAVTPNSYNYGSVTVGSFLEKTFVVKNEGTADLHVATTILSGTNAMEFQIQSGGGAYSLAPGATRNMVVRFSPTSAGSKSAKINITSNDPDESPFPVLLSGSAPDISSTWTAQTSGSTSLLFSTYFTDTNRGNIVGQYGIALNTTNGGGNWVIRTSGTSAQMYSVFFINANQGWACGSAGTILKTTNGGSSWTAQTSGTTANLNSVFFINANTGWVVGFTGTILKTTNGGSTWTTQTSGTTRDMYSVYFVDANTGWAVGNLGTILKTTNGGSNWTPQTSGVANYLRSVCFADANRGWAVGTYGTILNTTNGGTNWTPQTSGTSNFLRAVCFIDANTGWAVGYEGTIIKTTNSGSNWVSETSGTTNDLYAVSFVDAQSGWAVGESGTILSTKTTTVSPDISVSPGSYNFGAVTVGSYLDKTFVVKNEGTADLHVATTILSGANVMEFKVQSGGGAFTLAPGATQNLVVRFSPTSSGSKSAILSIASDDPDKNPFNISLTGAGSSNPPIYPDAATTQSPGAEFWVDINVGSNTRPVTNLFGVTFDLSFAHTDYIDVVTPHSSHVIPGDFLGSDVLPVANVDESAGKVGFGVTRKAGQPGVNGIGTVAKIKFIARSNTPANTSVQFSLSNVVASDPGGNSIPLDSGTLSVTISGLIVWPGDTNNDKIVNQVDVLPIGLNWGKTGPARPNASMAWQGQSATPWNPINVTYADANGDGAVNQIDVLPIGLNWGKTHTAFFVDQTMNSISPSVMPETAIITLKCSGSTNPGEHFNIDVFVKNLKDLFGLSFELYYSPTSFIDSIKVAEGAGNVLGNDIVFFSIVDKNASLDTGKVSVGLSRKFGQPGVSADSGLVARINAYMSPTAEIKKDATVFWFKNIVANDPAGNTIAFMSEKNSWKLVTGSGQLTNIKQMIQAELPAEFVLSQNHPNPFNPTTTISYTVAKTSHVKLTVYNTLGQVVAVLVNGLQAQGSYSVTWNAQNQPSGLYICRFEADSFRASKKMFLQK